METGEKIKILREQNSMTLEELGNKVGVGKSTVRKWENGMIENMRKDKITKLANALNCSPAYLMGWENEANVMTKGGRIKLLREQKGITQEELAKLLNTTKQTVSKYENGIVTNIPSDKLDEIAKILDTTPNYLMCWEDRSEGSSGETARKIGKKINMRRMALKISAEELGKKIGKDRSTIYRYEKGDIEHLPLDILEPISKALETTPAYLMGLESKVEESPFETANKLSEIFPDQESSVIQEIIKARRNELGLSVREVAQALNVAPSTISRYESSDIQNMGIDKIEALAKVLRCSPGYLMGWENKVEGNPVETANQLSEIFLDQELMEMISTYQSLDADKKKQVRDFIYFLKWRS